MHTGLFGLLVIAGGASGGLNQFTAYKISSFALFPSIESGCKEILALV